MRLSTATVSALSRHVRGPPQPGPAVRRPQARAVQQWVHTALRQRCVREQHAMQWLRTERCAKSRPSCARKRAPPVATGGLAGSSVMSHW